MTPDIDLVDPVLYVDGDPHAVWRWLRHHRQVHWHEPSHGFPGFWALTKHADVMSVLHDPEVFSSEGGILLRPLAWGPDPGGGRTLALTDPPRHRKLRALVQGWFAERAVRAMHEQLRAIAAEIVDRAIALEECDFVQEVAARFPLYVICQLMGVPDGERERILSLTSRAFGSDDPRRQRMAHFELIGYLTRLCHERSRDPRDDIVNVLARAEIDGEPLNERDLMFNCDNVLVAGTENVRIASSGGLLQLIGADQWDALRRHPERIERAVDEVLRWATTPTHLMRTVRTSAVVGGAGPGRRPDRALAPIGQPRRGGVRASRRVRRNADAQPARRPRPRPALLPRLLPRPGGTRHPVYRARVQARRHRAVRTANVPEIDRGQRAGGNAGPVQATGMTKRSTSKTTRHAVRYFQSAGARHRCSIADSTS